MYSHITDAHMIGRLLGNWLTGAYLTSFEFTGRTRFNFSYDVRRSGPRPRDLVLAVDSEWWLGDYDRFSKLRDEMPSIERSNNRTRSFAAFKGRRLLGQQVTDASLQNGGDLAIFFSRDEVVRVSGVIEGYSDGSWHLELGNADARFASIGADGDGSVGAALLTALYKDVLS